MSHVTHFGGPAAPANSATITLLDTTTMYGFPTSKMVARQRMSMLEFIWLQHGTNASAANGVRAYASSDSGANWREVDFKNDSNVATIGSAAAVQVPAVAAGAEWRETFFVAPYPDVKITYTAGATAPTTWEMVIAMHAEATAAVR